MLTGRRASPGIAAITLFLLGHIAGAVRAQCVDSSEVNDFRVRRVIFKSLFGRTPRKLRELLESHRGDRYSADRASQYIREIVQFRLNDPVEQKYERLITNKLKFSVKAGRTSLECVSQVPTAECAIAFPGESQCVDVTIRRYYVEVDALDTSPYLLLFPRSALTVLYGAMPRPLLALNPSFDNSQDRRFGPSFGIDTATDLLDLGEVFGEKETPKSPTPLPSVSEDSSNELSITTGGASASSALEDNPPPLEQSQTKLLFAAKARKSLSKSFYETSLGLSFRRTRPLGRLQQSAFEAEFEGRNVPQGLGAFRRNALKVGFSGEVRPENSFIKIIQATGKYRWSHNRLLGPLGIPGEVTDEHGYQTRVAIDGAVAKGLARGMVWFDGGVPQSMIDSYRRMTITVGYGKELALRRRKSFHVINPPELARECWTSYAADPKKNEQTISLEILAGGGKAWGTVPEYARFYAGNPAGQFLYDDLNAQSLNAVVAGPIVRGLGHSRGGLPSVVNVQRGSTSFWHANVSVGLPVRGWSRPLIPHEWVTVSPLREDDREFLGNVPQGADICRDLKATVKTLVRVSGVNLLINQQARDKLTDAEKSDLRLRNRDSLSPGEAMRLAAAEAALTKAKQEVRPQVEQLFAREILPVTDFIADHANIVSVKPMLMFDVGRLGHAADDFVRYAAGGGIQIDVVLARFELGYMANLKRVAGDNRGQFVGRLVLKRFF